MLPEHIPEHIRLIYHTKDNEMKNIIFLFVLFLSLFRSAISFANISVYPYSIDFEAKLPVILISYVAYVSYGPMYPYGASLMAQLVKNQPAMRETLVLIPCLG